MNNLSATRHDAPKAPLSLCIVSNRPDDLLLQIIGACILYVDEVLIGYDGPAEGIPAAFHKPDSRVRLIPLTWEGYSNTKNKLAALARNNWIWSLDGDELPDEVLLQAVATLPFEALPPATMLSQKRLSFFEGKKIRHGAWGRDYVIRIYNKTYTGWDQAVVHEKLEVKEDTCINNLSGILWHYTADSYAVFLEKNRKYARLAAEKYFIAGKKSPWWKRLVSPAFTFWKEYLFQGGFLDGKAGRQIAGINAAYTRWKYQFLHEKYQEASS